jgi:hypothetical protein
MYSMLYMIVMKTCNDQYSLWVGEGGCGHLPILPSIYDSPAHFHSTGTPKYSFGMSHKGNKVR